MRNILEDDSIHYLFSLCDEMASLRKDVLYFHIEKDAGLSSKDIDLIVDSYNQRNQTRGEYLGNKLFGLAFSGYSGELLRDLGEEVDRVNRKTC
jgi:hypothetical protein